MRDLDLKVLRWMRTHGHTPAVEDAAVALGKAGNNALVWVVLGLALAIIDNGMLNGETIRLDGAIRMAPR